MRHNHFSMLPDRAFQPRAFGGMTLEGGFFGGGGGGGSPPPPPTRTANPQPIAPYQSAGGGFMGSGAPTAPVSENLFNKDYYLKQNPTVAQDPYYKDNPYHHYQDFGFVERRMPYENFQYAPSQQPMFDPSLRGVGGGQMVTDAYSRILGRMPDQGSFDYFSNRMQQGLTGQGLVGGLTSMPEFQRQRQYQNAFTEAFRPGYQEFGPNRQFYQPIYQSSFANYQQPSSFYQPSYDFGIARNPFSMRSSFGGYNRPFFFEEGGEVEDDDDSGIAGLLKK